MQAQAFELIGLWDVDRDPTTVPVRNQGAAVTFSFVTSDTVRQVNTANGFVTPITEALPRFSDDVIRSAFDAWSGLANITFTEVSDSGLDHFEGLDAGREEAGADIRIGAFNIDGRGSTRARANVRRTPNIAGIDREILGTLLTFDLSETWSLDGISRGLDLFNIAAHEIGHAIGLDHTNVTPSLMNVSSVGQRRLPRARSRTISTASRPSTAPPS